MLFDVIAVKPLADYKILVTFENSEQKVFDVTPLLNKPRWQELRDIKLFNTVKAIDGTVAWLHEQDISPDWLYSDSVPYTEDADER